MKIFQFTKESGTHISKFNSNFVMSKIARTDYPAHIGYVQLDAGGVIGYHQAVIPQLLLVVNGEGEVCGEDKICRKLTKVKLLFGSKTNFTKHFQGTVLLQSLLNPKC
jgi:hypothetical protein